MIFSSVKENVSGAEIPSEAGMKGTPWGQGQLGTVAQGHSSPKLPPIVMKILGQDQKQIIHMEN